MKNLIKWALELDVYNRDKDIKLLKYLAKLDHIKYWVDPSEHDGKYFYSEITIEGSGCDNLLNLSKWIYKNIDVKV